MNDFISHEALFKAVDDYAGTHPVMHDSELFALFCSVPAADVRPVVLCGDCEFYGCRMDALREVGFCKRTDAITGAYDFCSRGVKREES